MAGVNGIAAVDGGIARSVQGPSNGSTISLRAKAPIPYAAEPDQLDGAESSSTLYDFYSVSPTSFSGGRSPNHEPPRDFGKKNGLREDRQMPPERLSPHHTDSDAAKEAHHPGEFSRSGHPYVRELQDRQQFSDERGSSRLKVRSDALSAEKPSAPSSSSANQRVEYSPEQPKIEFRAGQALQMLLGRQPVAASAARRGVPEAFQEAPSSVPPKLYAGGAGRVFGFTPKPSPTLQMTA
jgi:hypothetical protein